MRDLKNMADRPRLPGDETGIAADHWAQRMASGSLRPDEARAFNQWIAADPAHETEFRAAQALRKELTHVRDIDEYEDWLRPSLYEWAAARLMSLRNAIALPFRGRVGVWTFGGGLAAASVLIAVFAIFAMERQETSIEPPHLATKVAEVKDVALPDGSVVTIGAASSISIDYSEGVRRVILSEGEAFFDVKKDPERPFIVVANNTLVRVLGTKFDVSIDSDAVSVAVSEGRVEVIQPESGAGVIRERDVKHVLLAGQQVTAPVSGRVQPVRQIRAEDVASWRRGELAWADTPIKDIIADLNRYSQKDIILRARNVADLEYTLAVQADDVSGALDLIAASLNLEIEESEDGVVVLR